VIYLSHIKDDNRMAHHEFDHGILYHGDCLEIMPTLDIKVDMILADLPYG